MKVVPRPSFFSKKEIEIWYQCESCGSEFDHSIDIGVCPICKKDQCCFCLDEATCKTGLSDSIDYLVDEGVDTLCFKCIVKLDRICTKALDQARKKAYMFINKNQKKEKKMWQRDEHVKTSNKSAQCRQNLKEKRNRQKKAQRLARRKNR